MVYKAKEDRGGYCLNIYGPSGIITGLCLIQTDSGNSVFTSLKLSICSYENRYRV